MNLDKIVFANPQYFWLLLIIPLVIVFRIIRRKSAYPALMFSNSEQLKNVSKSIRQRIAFLPFLFRLIAYTLIIISLARPQVNSVEKDVHTEGIDIVLAMDVSTSMEAEDFKPNRLAAAKETAKNFIDYRLNDRIGLVLFAAESFTQCPVTYDHNILKSMFKDIKTKMLQDGTAIGMGLSTAISRLKDSKAKSRVIILLTDGVNNTGKISPLTAADIAKTYNIRIYTIGVGTRGKAPVLVDTPFGKQYAYMDVEIDEDLLENIAKTTGGEYFRATNNKTLENIYQKIDRLEKTKLKENSYKSNDDKFFFPLGLAGIFILLELLLSFMIFKRIP